MVERLVAELELDKVILPKYSALSDGSIIRNRCEVDLLPSCEGDPMIGFMDLCETLLVSDAVDTE